MWYDKDGSTWEEVEIATTGVSYDECRRMAKEMADQFWAGRPYQLTLAYGHAPGVPGEPEVPEGSYRTTWRARYQLPADEAES